jgi:uncharacterized protein (DUF1499 family)
MMGVRVHVLCVVCVVVLLSCGGKRPTALGVTSSGLAPCPDSPNCVSSYAKDEAHRTAPFVLNAPAEVAWSALLEEVNGLHRSKVIQEGPNYLHVECTSALFRYVDDLELQLRPREMVIAVRSASRVGRSDLGVNRKRVEELRAALKARGVVR